MISFFLQETEVEVPSGHMRNSGISSLWWNWKQIPDERPSCFRWTWQSPMLLTKLSHTEQNYGWEPYNICCLGNHPSTEPALSHKWRGEEVCQDRRQCKLLSSFPVSRYGLRMPYRVNRNLIDTYRPKDPSFPNPHSKIPGPPLGSSQKLPRFLSVLSTLPMLSNTAQNASPWLVLHRSHAGTWLPASILSRTKLENQLLRTNMAAHQSSHTYLWGWENLPYGSPFMYSITSKMLHTHLERKINNMPSLSN